MYYHRKTHYICQVSVKSVYQNGQNSEHKFNCYTNSKLRKFATCI